MSAAARNQVDSDGFASPERCPARKGTECSRAVLGCALYGTTPAPTLCSATVCPAAFAGLQPAIWSNSGIIRSLLPSTICRKACIREKEKHYPLAEGI